MTQTLSALAADHLAAALEQCGMPVEVISVVTAKVPFTDDAALLTAVDRAILTLKPADLPRILGVVPVPEIGPGDAAVQDAARLALRLYRDRFGYPFVSAVATPTADELLMRVRIRLGNEPDPESRAAREHLRRIVRARLATLGESAV